MKEAVRTSFRACDEAAAVDALGRYAGPEPERVRLAIVELSEGDLRKLEHFVSVAGIDYRDVLWWAEHPRSSFADFSRRHPRQG